MPNLTRFLEEKAQQIPDEVAVVQPDHSIITYAQLDRFVNAATSLLVQEDLSAGDVIVHLFSDEALAMVFMLATARIGATVYSIPVHAPEIQRDRMAAAVPARSVLTDTDSWDSDLEMRVISLNWLDLESVDDSLVVLADPDPMAPWLINTGSGTTGKPKLIEVTHAIFLARMKLYSDVIQPGVGDRIISLLHLDLPSAKNQLLNALFEGATVCFYNRTGFDPVNFIEAYRISVVYCTSSHLRLLARLKQTTPSRDTASLRAVVPAGSTVTDDLRQVFREQFGDVLFVRYGTAETGPLADARPGEVLVFPGTVGKPLTGIRFEIVDESDEPVPAGEIGSIRIHSPAVIEAYRDDELVSSRTFRHGWFYPGDMGRLTEDGQLIFCGREDDMMIMDGINIFPIEIEHALLEHPAVQEAVAFPLTHDVYQEIPVCAVTLHAGSDTNASLLSKYARDRLGIRAPRKVVIIDEIPRNEQGKIVKEALIASLQGPEGSKT